MESVTTFFLFSLINCELGGGGVNEDFQQSENITYIVVVLIC